MSATPPPGYTPPPADLPQRGIRATFSNLMDTWITWFSATVLAQVAAMVANAYTNALAAFDSATAAAGSEAAADASAISSANSASASAASAGAPVWVSGATYAQYAAVLSPANTRTYRKRTPSSSSTTDPSLDSTNWAPATEYGVKGNDIASAATINLSNIGGDYAHITGTAGITAITIPIGAERTAITDGVLTVTASAALTLPGGVASITTIAGSRLIIRGDTAGAVVVAHLAGTATAAEIKDGASTAKTISPAGMLAAAGFSAYFESADQTITLAGALTIAHGLGRQPVLVQAFLRCVTDGAGYSVGDVVPVSIGADASTTPKGVSVVPDATNLNIRYGTGGGSSASAFYLVNKSTGEMADALLANWKFVLRAWA